MAAVEARGEGGGALGFFSRNALFRRDPSFGRIASSPVEREIDLTAQQYLAFAASGAACTSIVRTLLVPLDVCKTLIQSRPEEYPDTRQAAAALWRDGGLPSLYRSVDVTAVSGLLLGGFGFGFNEFLRRYFASLAGPQAQALYAPQISIGAALVSVLITALAICPFEVLRIRAIEAGLDGGGAADAEDAAGAGDGPSLASSGSLAPPWRQQQQQQQQQAAVGGGGSGTGGAASSPSAVLTKAGAAVESVTPRAPTADAETAADLAAAAAAPSPSDYTVLTGLATLYSEGGVGLLYSALGPLVLRELPFTITKFLVYDATTQAVSAAFPSVVEISPALLSLMGGLAAGITAAIVSTPADTLLTLTQTPKEGDPNGAPPTLSEALASSLSADPLSLFRGTLPRCVFFGALIAGQFWLYDDLKRLFKVAPDDLLYYLDVFTDRLSFYE